VPTRPGDYGTFYRAVAATVRFGAAPPVTIDDAISVLDVLDAAGRSAALGDVVRLGDR
jgi:scyllo-inositol 2-dehydrogenase (NADP+)